MLQQEGTAIPTLLSRIPRLKFRSNAANSFFKKKKYETLFFLKIENYLFLKNALLANLLFVLHPLLHYCHKINTKLHINL